MTAHEIAKEATGTAVTVALGRAMLLLITGSVRGAASVALIVA